jgi:hypothetical protein
MVNDELSLLGDGQYDVEKGISKKQVIAKVVCVIRKGKKIQMDDFYWIFFEKIWLNIVPFRKLLWNLVKK